MKEQDEPENPENHDSPASRFGDKEYVERMLAHLKGLPELENPDFKDDQVRKQLGLRPLPKLVDPTSPDPTAPQAETSREPGPGRPPVRKSDSASGSSLRKKIGGWLEALQGTPWPRPVAGVLAGAALLIAAIFLLKKPFDPSDSDKPETQGLSEGGLPQDAVAITDPEIDEPSPDRDHPEELDELDAIDPGETAVAPPRSPVDPLAAGLGALQDTLDEKQIALIEAGIENPSAFIEDPISPLAAATLLELAEDPSASPSLRLKTYAAFGQWKEYRDLAFESVRSFRDEQDLAIRLIFYPRNERINGFAPRLMDYVVGLLRTRLTEGRSMNSAVDRALVGILKPVTSRSQELKDLFLRTYAASDSHMVRLQVLQSEALRSARMTEAEERTLVECDLLVHRPNQVQELRGELVNLLVERRSPRAGETFNRFYDLDVRVLAELRPYILEDLSLLGPSRYSESKLKDRIVQVGGGSSRVILRFLDLSRGDQDLARLYNPSVRIRPGLRELLIHGEDWQELAADRNVEDAVVGYCSPERYGRLIENDRHYLAQVALRMATRRIEDAISRTSKSPDLSPEQRRHTSLLAAQVRLRRTGSEEDRREVLSQLRDGLEADPGARLETLSAGFPLAPELEGSAEALRLLTRLRDREDAASRYTMVIEIGRLLRKGANLPVDPDSWTEPLLEHEQWQVRLAAAVSRRDAGIGDDATILEVLWNLERVPPQLNLIKAAAPTLHAEWANSTERPSELKEEYLIELRALLLRTTPFDLKKKIGRTVSGSEQTQKKDAERSFLEREDEVLQLVEKCKNRARSTLEEDTSSTTHENAIALLIQTGTPEAIDAVRKYRSAPHASDELIDEINRVLDFLGEDGDPSLPDGLRPRIRHALARSVLVKETSSRAKRYFE